MSGEPLHVMIVDDEPLARVRLRDLLADHLRVAPARVAQVYRANDRSLLRTVERLRDNSCLMPYEVDESHAAPPVAFSKVLDPAEPFTIDRVISSLKP